MFNSSLFKKSAMSALLATSLIACDEVPSVSILSETEDFVQAASEVNNKIDILWIVDNSGSMHDSQVALANNFEAFIQDIDAKNYDFQIAVITTEAYIGGNRAAFKSSDGDNIFTPNTTNLQAKFMEAVMVGVSGSPSERGMHSLEVALLEHTENKALDFPRKDAFFSVIVVSDEQDGSRNGPGNTYPGKNHFLGILDTIRLGDTIAGKQTYSVNAIVRLPENAGCTSGTNGTRYIEMVEATEGIVADICGDFGTSLTEITSSIVQLSTQFYLEREPIIETIVVSVNGVNIANDSTNGWTYDADSNSIKFHGTAVPAQGASIAIDFDPVKLKN